MAQPAESEGADPWADDPVYGADDWRQDVANGDTRLGYADWLAHNREAEIAARQELAAVESEAA
jgi:hypothetical protein